MCRNAKPDRSVKLYEGHLRVIMELETPEERLAAFETVFAIAFPKNEDKPYVPPELPEDGKKSLSKGDRARRLAYNIFNGLIRFQSKDGDGSIKDSRKVDSGRLGAAKRWGQKGDSSTASTDETSKVQTCNALSNQEVPQAIQEDDFTGYVAGRTSYRKDLTKEEKEIVADWDKKIPDAKALQAFLKDNYLLATRATALKLEFCEYAFQRLAREDRWISTRNGRPLRNINMAIHFLALSYVQQLGQVKRLENEERRKDLESEFNLKTTEQSQMSSTELADLERRRRRKAEKEAMEKILKGEL